MELLNQPFNAQLGRRLIDLFASTDYQHLTIIVAFARNSGVLRLRDAIAAFRGRGGTVDAYVGVDLGGTSYEALTNLLLDTDTLSVVHTQTGQVFHSKIYHFRGAQRGVLIVGSHNLTGGGLWTNFESSLLIPTDGTDADGARLQAQVQSYVAWLGSLGKSLKPIAKQADIDELLQGNYVAHETTLRARHAMQSRQSGKQAAHIFGNGAHAPLPAIAAPAPPPAPALAPLPPVAPVARGGAPASSRTIWLESKRMTGGSRNILDLSMQSLVERGDPTGTIFDRGDPRLMWGAVVFFGLDPQNTKAKRLITLNFEGVDYRGNEILFPTGSRANGTWRLQIKGVSLGGQKITEAFRHKGATPYLMQKVLTFTKIDTDYYSLFVAPETDIAIFETASFLLARNGQAPGAKRIGLF